MHAVTTTPAATDETYFARTFHRLRPSPSVGRVGSCIGCFGACSVFTLHYGLHVSPSRLRTLYIRGSGSFVASAAAPIATGWSEPVPGRDFQPAVDQRLYTAHQQPLASLGCMVAMRLARLNSLETGPAPSLPIRRTLHPKTVWIVVSRAARVNGFSRRVMPGCKTSCSAISSPV